MLISKGLLALLVTFSHLMYYCAGFAFDVKPGSEECFFQEITSVNVPVGVIFQVTLGGHLDIDFKIFSPTQKIIYYGRHEQDGRYAFTTTESGSFGFCFGNQMSTVTSKEVQFLLSLGYPQQVELENVATDEEMSPLMDVTVQLMEAVDAIANDQQYLKLREIAHRSTNESTSTRVLWWSVFEMLILVLMSMLQVMYLKRFFEVTRPL